MSETGWRPIETAPKDGTHIRVRVRWQGRGWPEPIYNDDEARWTDHNGGGWVHYVLGDPVEWMPLPPPPGGPRP